jgi:hypothetical protein
MHSIYFILLRQAGESLSILALTPARTGLPGVEPPARLKPPIQPREKRWPFELHSPPWSDLLSIAGGLVFGGTNEGNLFDLDRLGEAGL